MTRRSGHVSANVVARKRCNIPGAESPRQCSTSTRPCLDEQHTNDRAGGTWFVLGSHAERWPELVRRISHEGHQIGNHGYFHRKLQFKSPFYVSRDIRLGIRAIRRAGAPAPRYFRAPHGFRSPWTTPIASAYGERTVGWSLGVWDSDRPGVAEIVRRTLEGVSPGSIVLLHDGDGYNPDGDRMQTAAALPHIIDGLKTRGYEFATLPTE